MRRMDHERFIDEDAAHGIRHGVLRELLAHFLKNAYINPRLTFVVLRGKIGIELDPPRSSVWTRSQGHDLF